MGTTNKASRAAALIVAALLSLGLTGCRTDRPRAASGVIEGSVWASGPLLGA